MASYFFLVALIPGLLLCCGLIPSNWANHHPQLMKRLTIGTAVVSFILAMAAAVTLGCLGPLHTSFLVFGPAQQFSVGLYFDGLAAVMLVLISFLGFVVTCYSQRYLDGEPSQGRFFRWTAFTLGAVLTLVVSCNLVMFTAAWMLTSFGLHHLLTHYPNRPAAQLAARQKFLISRLGDLFLLAGIVFAYRAFGSFEYADIFAASHRIANSSAPIPWSIHAMGALFVLGAMTKSAQFPFHSWLPDTMETPTPVSALMHAGVINAGGFLMIRLSPLMTLSEPALHLLVSGGTITALFGAVVMLTQTNIKRSLAYSTIAQMGFMMLQCGLGAFSAALLHIVAHSLYKSHAFLSSGSVLDLAARNQVEVRLARGGFRSIGTLFLALAVGFGVCVGVATLLGISLNEKPGGLILAMILSIALAHLVWTAIMSGNAIVAAFGFLAATGLSACYFGAYLLFDYVLASDLPQPSAASSIFHIAWCVTLALGFLAVFGMQFAVTRFNHWRPLVSLYVHASNGFYFDIAAQRLTARLWNRLPIGDPLRN